MYTSKIIPLYTAFLHSIKFFGYRIGIQFHKNVLAVGQNNYTVKIANAYVVYDLDDCPKFKKMKIKKLLVWFD